MAEKHCAVHKGNFFFPDLVNTISASPVVAAVLEGPYSIAAVRAMVGATRPHEAAPGTIRGDYALVGLRNLIHACRATSARAAQQSAGVMVAALVIGVAATIGSLARVLDGNLLVLVAVTVLASDVVALDAIRRLWNREEAIARA